MHVCVCVRVCVRVCVCVCVCICVGMGVIIIFIIIITNCIKTFKFKKKRGKAQEGPRYIKGVKISLQYKGRTCKVIKTDQIEKKITS